MHCGGCGAEIPDDRPVCPSCGDQKERGRPTPELYWWLSKLQGRLGFGTSMQWLAILVPILSAMFILLRDLSAHRGAGALLLCLVAVGFGYYINQRILGKPAYFNGLGVHKGSSNFIIILGDLTAICCYLGLLGAAFWGSFPANL